MTRLFFFLCENLKPAVINFSEESRHQLRKRGNILQSIDNGTDSVKLLPPAEQAKREENLYKRSPSRGNNIFQESMLIP